MGEGDLEAARASPGEEDALGDDLDWGDDIDLILFIGVGKCSEGDLSSSLVFIGIKGEALRLSMRGGNLGGVFGIFRLLSTDLAFNGP